MAIIRYAEYLHVKTDDIIDNNTHLEEGAIEDVIGARVLEYVLTQHSLDNGLKLYGKKGEHATKKELKQLHDMATFEPVDSKNLTEEEKCKAIASLMFLTEKRDGLIKARVCADDRKE